MFPRLFRLPLNKRLEIFQIRLQGLRLQSRIRRDGLIALANFFVHPDEERLPVTQGNRREGDCSTDKGSARLVGEAGDGPDVSGHHNLNTAV